MDEDEIEQEHLVILGLRIPSFGRREHAETETLLRVAQSLSQAFGDHVEYVTASGRAWKYDKFADEIDAFIEVPL